MHPYTAMVVDDEPTILRGMVETYDWAAAGFTVRATAHSGESALAQAAEQMPDVIVADIRMKGMDGLELIRRVRALSDTVACVVVSAYKDFSYAKTACELGAFSYLLKPFSDEEFLSVMRSLHSFLDKTRAQGRALELLRRYRDDILVQRLRQYLTGGAGEGELAALLRAMGGDLREDCWFCCACADVDVTAGIFLGDAPGHRYVQFRLLAEAMGEQGRCIHFELPDGRLLLIRHGGPGESREVYPALGRAIDALGEQGHGFHAACGEALEGLAGLRRSFEQAVAGIELTYERDGQRLIRYRSQARVTASHYRYPKAKELEILGAIRSGEYDALEGRVAEFQDLVERMNAGGPFARGCYQLLCLNIQFLLFQLYDLEEGDLAVYHSLLDNLDKLAKDRFAGILRHAVLAVIRDYEERAGGRMGSAGPYVEAAMAFVEEHLGRADLSVVEAADHLHLNAVYFGRLFKRVTGKSFREYLAGRRIERAGALLATTAMSVTEVALSVGMDNLSYFSSQFKKTMGTLPSEYRGAGR